MGAKIRTAPNECLFSRYIYEAFYRSLGYFFYTTFLWCDKKKEASEKYHKALRRHVRLVILFFTVAKVEYTVSPPLHNGTCRKRSGDEWGQR